MTDSVPSAGPGHDGSCLAPRGLMATGGRAALCLLVTLLAPSGHAWADLPQPVRAYGHTLAQVGEGRLSLFGVDIYSASLWTKDGVFDGYDQEPVALALWYERRFSVKELIDIVDGQWRRIDLGSEAQRRAWRAAVTRLWVDVDRGDNLTAVVIPGRETLFFDRDRLLGRIDDPAFGPAYLAIWLHPRSAVRDLRVALLGAGHRD